MLMIGGSLTVFENEKKFGMNDWLVLTGYVTRREHGIGVGRLFYQMMTCHLRY